MSAPKFVIPLDDEDENEVDQPVKRYFKPGSILEKIQQEQNKTNDKQAEQPKVGEIRKPEKAVEKEDPVLDKDVDREMVRPGTSASSFEAAFANLKGSKFYEEPPAPKVTDSPKKPESYPLKTASVLVNPRQKGNPLLKNIRNVPWEFLEIEPDYVMGQSTCALFLSLRYFNLYPNYIHDRLKALGKSFQLRVLLVLVDVADPYPPLRDISRIAIYTDCTLMLAWSSEEAGQYIETYKILENKSADSLMERQDDDAYSKIIDSLTKVKTINQTNATTLLTTYGSLDKVLKASAEELTLLPGMGPQKAKKLHSVMHQPFLKSK